MGAILCAEGATFRVWAPHADAVAVKGSFNGWQRASLTHEADGYWATHVPGVKAGDEYKFCLRTGEDWLDRNDPYARDLTHSAGNSRVYDPQAFDWGDDAFQMPSFNEVVLYEMHVGTFAPATGTFHEAAERLDYLRDLGVNAVELMPVAEFAGDTSWGYNPAYPFAVEQAYGGPDALKAFVRAAHARGIGVILDVVYNHLGPSDLDLWQFDGWQEHGRGGIYFYNDDRARTPWGDTRPDYGRAEVRRYLLDNVATWLGEFRIDGLRLDMTPHIYTSDAGPLEEGWTMMQAITHYARTEHPGTLIIAEDLHNNPAITATTDDGGAGFHAQWDARFVHPVRAALVASVDESRDLAAVVAAVRHRFGPDPFSRVIYTESHDEVANGQARVPEEVWPGNAASKVSQQRAALGAVLVLTSPGIPMLFQGQEFLADRYFQDTEPLDWGRLAAFEGIHTLFRDLIALRRNLGGLTAGLTGANVELLQQDEENKVLAYHRWLHGGVGDDVVVVVNLASTPHEAYTLRLPHAGNWQLVFNSTWAGYSDAFAPFAVQDVAAAPGAPPTATLALPGYTALVFARR